MGCRARSFGGLGLEGLGFKDLRFWGSSVEGVRV